MYLNVTRERLDNLEEGVIHVWVLVIGNIFKLVNFFYHNCVIVYYNIKSIT